MKKIIFVIGLVVLFMAMPSCVFAQQKCPMRQLDCGCEIIHCDTKQDNYYSHKCGKCGGTLEFIVKSAKSLSNYHVSGDYVCKDCPDKNNPHRHTALSDEYDYIHVCKEKRCVVYKKGEPDADGYVTFRFTNICKLKKSYTLIVFLKQREKLWFNT